MFRLSEILDHAVVYRLWQAPFEEAKFAPVKQHADLPAVRRALDIGCGPGTNAHHFRNVEYVGVDINRSYIEHARKRFQGRFRVCDARDLAVNTAEKFDLVLLNSFLHHFGDEDAAAILEKARISLKATGQLHLIDLVLPSQPSIARTLARYDRGSYARPLLAWKELCTASFQPIVVQPFTVRLMGIPLWKLLYFKGRPLQ